jgi:hypothetical protein
VYALTPESVLAGLPNLRVAYGSNLFLSVEKKGRTIHLLKKTSKAVP